LTKSIKSNTTKIDKKGEKVSSSLSNNSRKCFKCQGFGHIVANYPNRRVVSFVEEASNEEREEKKDALTASDDEITLAIMVRLVVC